MLSLTQSPTGSSSSKLLCVANESRASIRTSPTAIAQAYAADRVLRLSLIKLSILKRSQ